MDYYLDGLACYRVHSPRRSHLELIEDHVSKALVVDDADVDVGSKLLPRYARIHGLVAIIIVSCGEELLAKVIHRRIFFSESTAVHRYVIDVNHSAAWMDLLERCCILRQTVHSTSLPCHTLD